MDGLGFVTKIAVEEEDVNINPPVSAWKRSVRDGAYSFAEVPLKGVEFSLMVDVVDVVAGAAVVKGAVAEVMEDGVVAEEMPKLILTEEINFFARRGEAFARKLLSRSELNEKGMSRTLDHGELVLLLVAASVLSSREAEAAILVHMDGYIWSAVNAEVGKWGKKFEDFARIDMDDLYSAGKESALKTIRKVDFTRVATFRTYLYEVALMAVRDELNNHSHAIGNKYVRMAARKVYKLDAAGFTDKEVKKRGRVKTDKVLLALRAFSGGLCDAISFDAPIGGEDASSTSRWEKLADRSDGDKGVNFCEGDYAKLMQIMRDAFDGSRGNTERYMMVVCSTFGLNGYSEMTFQEIADACGVKSRQVPFESLKSAMKILKNNEAFMQFMRELNEVN